MIEQKKPAGYVVGPVTKKQVLKCVMRFTLDWWRELGERSSPKKYLLRKTHRVRTLILPRASGQRQCASVICLADDVRKKRAMADG